jgi:hypothetical protein
MAGIDAIRAQKAQSGMKALKTGIFDYLSNFQTI